MRVPVCRNLQGILLSVVNLNVDIITYITTTDLGDGSRRGSTEVFILHWHDQIRKYNSLVRFDAIILLHQTHYATKYS